MARVTRLEEVQSIKVGPGSTVLPDGTIQDPEPYEAVNIECDDGLRFQVERPLTIEKIRAAKDAAEDAAKVTIDEVAIGDEI